MFLLPLLLAVGADDGHLTKNPLYAELRKSGVSIGADKNTPLPEPTMPDGLSKEEQTQVLTAIAKRGRYRTPTFTRNSVVGPQVLVITDMDKAADNLQPRSVDFWFVAYGSIDKITDQKFLDSLKSGGNNNDLIELKEKDLAARKIEIKKEQKDYEGYAHVGFTFLESVRLQTTSRNSWSKTDESLVMAMRIDPRFGDDKEFPNYWQGIDRRTKKPAGEKKMFDSAGYYAKITQLKEPAGALFGEVHVIYAEPNGWFAGPRLLRAKLPPAVQITVRDLRRKILSANRD